MDYLETLLVKDENSHKLKKIKDKIHDIDNEMYLASDCQEFFHTPTLDGTSKDIYSNKMVNEPGYEDLKMFTELDSVNVKDIGYTDSYDNVYKLMQEFESEDFGHIKESSKDELTFIFDNSKLKNLCIENNKKPVYIGNEDALNHADNSLDSTYITVNFNDYDTLTTILYCKDGLNIGCEPRSGKDDLDKDNIDSYVKELILPEVPNQSN